MATKKTQKAATGPTCAIGGCDKPVYVRGVCEVHWNDPKACARRQRIGPAVVPRKAGKRRVTKES
jgi:hypothetical protein